LVLLEELTSQDSAEPWLWFESPISWKVRIHGDKSSWEFRVERGVSQVAKSIRAREASVAKRRDHAVMTLISWCFSPHCGTRLSHTLPWPCHHIYSACQLLQLVPRVRNDAHTSLPTSGVMSQCNNTSRRTPCHQLGLASTNMLEYLYGRQT
jgi:hypothetical protein